MSIHKSKYSFKDRTWYIVPWTIIEPDIHDAHIMPSYLVHDVDGDNPHRWTLWNYNHLKDGVDYCSTCDLRPSKKIQTLWTLENFDNPAFYEDY